MEDLPRPVTMTMFCMPECIASSTPYWIRGLSTTGSISFGEAFVAGRNRVPSPAAGNTALRTFAFIFRYCTHSNCKTTHSLRPHCPGVEVVLLLGFSAEKKA